MPINATTIIGFILTIVAIEFLLQTRMVSRSKDLVNLATKARNVLFSRSISDHWKEISVRIYAVRIFAHSLFLSGYIFIFVVTFFIPAVIVEKYFAPSFSMIDTLSDPVNIVVYFFLGLIYFSIRKWFARK